MLLRKTIKFEVFKLMEMQRTGQSYHHHVISYHFKSFTVPLGGPSWLLGEGGGGMHADRPRAPTQPPAYGPELSAFFCV